MTTEDANGHAIDGVSVTWSSDAAAVATVNDNGMATGVSQGTAHIAATTIDRVSGSSTVTVQAAAAQSWSISGTIAPGAGAGGTLMSLNGATAATTTADASGAYIFRNVANGSYVVTPGKNGSCFTPSGQSATVNGSNVAGVDFNISTKCGGSTGSVNQYVSPNGNNNWDGTAPTFTSGNHGPVADICHARDNLTSLGLLGITAAVIQFEDGSQDGGVKAYYATASCPYPVVFQARDSGTSSLPITYQNYPGDSPVFDGGARITGWSLSNAGLCAGKSDCYSTSLSPSIWNYFEGLFYNGVRRFRPRMGAGVTVNISSASVAGSASAAVATYTSPNTSPLQVASGVVVTGVTGGSGLNLPCSITALTSTTFQCDAPGAAGTGVGGTATVANTGQYYRVATGCAAACNLLNYTSEDPVQNDWSNVTVSNPGSGNPSNDIAVYSFQFWVASVGRICSINQATTICPNSSDSNITLTGSIGNATMPGFITGHRYLIENARELFGRPGQWFLDRNTTPNWTLYYITQPGDVDPNTDSVIVPQEPPTAPQLFSMTGAQWLTFEGLTFQHDNMVVLQGGYNDHQLNSGITDMVFCMNCQSITFLSNTFRQTMGSALNFQCSSACSNYTIQGNSFYDIGGNAVRIGALPNLTLVEADVPTGQQIDDNYFAYWGRTFPGSSAITLGLVNHTEIANNTGHDGYQKFIEGCKPTSHVCGGGSNNGFHDQNWHDNLCFNLGLGILDDLACYYMVNALPVGSAVNDIINHNLTHDIMHAAIDSDGYGGNGIYLDEQSGGANVTNNVVYRVSGVGLNMTKGPNTNITCGNLSNCQNVFQNNLVADALQSLIGVSACAPGSGAVPPSALLQFTALNNFFYSRMAPSYTIQKGNGFYFGAGSPRAFQIWANNQYYNPKTNWLTTGTAWRYASTDTLTDTTWLCGGTGRLSWTAWTATPVIPGTTGNEDAGSSIADPGFKHPYCTLATIAACAADPAQDDYSSTTTPGTSPVPPRGNPITLGGWGVTSSFAIPTVIDTFPIAPLNPSTDYCPVSCP